MIWNLVNSVEGAFGRRSFYVPLASIPPGESSIRNVNRDDFEIVVAPEMAGTVTSAVGLTVRIPIPAGGFQPEYAAQLPDPAIRLHAVTRSLVRFRPASTDPGHAHGNQLVLTMLPLFTSIFSGLEGLPVFPSWWRRWLDAPCIPTRVIYDNTDINVLRTTLENIVAPEDRTFANRVPPTHGLAFPWEITRYGKADFIDGFLAGDETYAMQAEAGAYLGAVAVDPTGPQRHALNIHVRYHDDDDQHPHPMNPCEFFNLVFGDDSEEALNHPLLTRLHQMGLDDQVTQPESLRKLRRPPLRTWKRVQWEATLEIQHHATNWRPAESLGPTRFYNDFEKNGLPFDDINYTGYDKCNLFISDICLRAGFRVRIQPVKDADGTVTGYHFLAAGQYCNEAHGHVELTKKVGTELVAWGRNLDAELRALDDTNRVTHLNNLIVRDGESIVLAGARAGTRSGHIVILGASDQGDLPPVLSLSMAPGRGAGLTRMRTWTMEASGSGAITQIYASVLGGQSGAASDGSAFIRIHLISLHPGKDPDLRQGINDLNFLTG